MKIGIFTIDKEGHKIILSTIVTIVAVLVLFLFSGLSSITWLTITVVVLALATLFIVIRFFRVPDRVMTQNFDAVLAPADGTIVAIEKVFVDEYLQDERMQVSVFMSILNVHANWYPISGTVEYFKHHHGDFLFANNPKSSTRNERTTIVVKHEGESIMFRQVAGYIARRIVTYVTLGKKVEQNERCGFIKFGSRVDIFLPLNYELNVKLNDKVVATKSIIAHKPKS